VDKEGKSVDDEGKNSREITTEEFEQTLSALIQVDPAGLSGKHRKPSTRENEEQTRSEGLDSGHA